MKIILDNIYKISYNNSLFTIECSNNIINGYIIDGSVKLNIYDNDNNIIGARCKDSINIFTDYELDMICHLVNGALDIDNINFQ